MGSAREGASRCPTLVASTCWERVNNGNSQAVGESGDLQGCVTNDRTRHEVLRWRWYRQPHMQRMFLAGLPCADYLLLNRCM